ncbi:MAG TPA: hypothetical protein VMT21_08035 [Gemmatimonadales bacterium]|nr:hypothetical protein [Gemmatimonadales bacterium]
MPADYRIDASERIVYCRAWGVLTNHDLETHRAALYADPAFRPDLAQLYDFTAVTKLEITADALRNLAETTRFSPTARRALVASTDLAFGMARMYSLMTQFEFVEVFRDEASAMRWLRSATA